MENSKKVLIVVSVALILSIAVHLQNEYVDFREAKQIAQEQVLQAKYDEGHTKGYEEGFTKQLSGDEKVRLGGESILGRIIKMIREDGQVPITTDEGVIILIKKVDEQ